MVDFIHCFAPSFVIMMAIALSFVALVHIFCFACLKKIEKDRIKAERKKS
jgi:uncharacterized protein YhhL (DUF1145 family)